jgi:hypothetical protein
VNGRNSLDIVHRFEIGVDAAGHFGIGPIAVRAGSEIFRSGLLTLDASAAATHLSGGGSSSVTSGPPSSTGAAGLIVDVLPPSPWQGQPCVLRVRLVQRASLAEDPQYTPPATPGFWTDKQSQPESYYADERRQRVLVTETRTRLYPLAAGVATIGEAEANLALATGADDPATWVGGKVPRREVVVRSRPVQVRVRALPAAAPAGFGGAVGNLSVHWLTDRTRTTVDVPITIWLDVRGVGNLPLVRPPALRADDIDVFASTVDDSLPSGPGDAMGRRRFQWTVLARRPGPLTVPRSRSTWARRCSVAAAPGPDSRHRWPSTQPIPARGRRSPGRGRSRRCSWPPRSPCGERPRRRSPRPPIGPARSSGCARSGVPAVRTSGVPPTRRARGWNRRASR